MNKNTDRADEHINRDAIEHIDNVELENVTGGCSRCGCGQPDAAASQRQLPPSTWLR